METGMTLEELRAHRPMTAMRNTHRPKPFKKPLRAKDLIPVVATGGIGDLIVSLYVCSQIGKQVGPVMLWTQHLEAAKTLMSSGSYHGIWLREDPFPGYDFWIQMNSAVNFRFEKNFKKFGNPGAARLHDAWQKFTSNGDWGRMCRHHPWLDNELGKAAQAAGLRRHTLPMAILGLTPVRHVPVDLKASSFDWEPFITVHDGFAEHESVTGRATKTWHMESWSALVKNIKTAYPGLKIIQLGGKRSRPIQGVDVDLTGRTSIAESLRLLSRSSVHIDGDSGLVHARAAMAMKSVVLFGPTPAGFFGYPFNDNISPRKCGDCWWLTDEWLTKCPLGNDKPVCMDSISPGEVYRAVRDCIESQKEKTV